MNKKAYTLFDYSQTCKNSLIEKGFDCENYDIKKDGYDLFSSDLSFIESGSFVFSFFPCDFFNEKSTMFINMNSKLFDSTIAKYGLKENFSKHYIESRNRNLSILQNHINILKEKKCRVIIENPRNTVDKFLEHFFKENGFEKMLIKDRSLYGDNFRKPTNFYYYNLQLSNNLVMYTKNSNVKIIMTRKGRKSNSRVCKKNQVSDINKTFFDNFLMLFEL